MQTQQMTLSLQGSDHASFDGFYPGCNASALAMLRTVAHGRGEHYVYLWGNQGAGCTHLLHATCNVADKLGLRTLYLSLADIEHLSLDVLEGLEALQLVCIDDIQNIVGKPDWEEAFFHCYNRMREEQKRLVIAGNVPPAKLGLQLLDLTSRLSAGVVFHVQDLSDEEKLEAIILRAKLRGIILSHDVARFLLRHYMRDMLSLMQALEELDHISLAEKRRVTIPFVKKVLDI